MIKDSGERREFETGAVRDIQEGKGRCDLMPLDVVSEILGDDSVIKDIHKFQEDKDPIHLQCAIIDALEYEKMFDGETETMLLEVSKHFEEGAKKYGEFNWQKGIPVKCYIDSAVRHYLKWLRHDDDEPHDRAFMWNMMCCLWEVKRERREGKNESA